MIVLEKINKFCLVNLITHLGHTYHSKSYCIQFTPLAIYISLNRAKNDLTHPIWSIVNKRFIRKCTWTEVYCTLDNVLDQTTLPVKQLLTNKNAGFDHVKFVFLFFVMLKVVDRYGDEWNKLVFEDQFVDGWQNWCCCGVTKCYNRGVLGMCIPLFSS